MDLDLGLIAELLLLLFVTSAWAAVIWAGSRQS
jgi:hypothetical protein